MILSQEKLKRVLEIVFITTSIIIKYCFCILFLIDNIPINRKRPINPIYQ